MAKVIFESGDLYFFYRPKTQEEVIKSLDDVEGFYLVMSAQGTKFRFLSAARKRMPEIPVDSPAQPDQGWAIVGYETENSDDLEDNNLDRQLTPEGKIVQPARPAGAAKYMMVHQEDRTELAYALEVPAEPGPVQGTFNILPEAAYVIKVKNPDYLAEGYPGVVQKPRYPVNFKALFDADLIDLKDKRLLNFPNAQVLLIGSRSQNIEEALDVEFEKEPADIAVDRLYGTFHMKKKEHPLEPLVMGRWPAAEEAA